MYIESAIIIIYNISKYLIKHRSENEDENKDEDENEEIHEHLVLLSWPCALNDNIDITPINTSIIDNGSANDNFESGYFNNVSQSYSILCFMCCLFVSLCIF